MEKYSEQWWNETAAKLEKLLAEMYTNKSTDELLERLLVKDYDERNEKLLKAEILKRCIN